MTIQSLILFFMFSGFLTPSYALSERLQRKVEASVYLAKSMCMSLYMDGNRRPSPKQIANMAYNSYRKDFDAGIYNESLTRRIFKDRVATKIALDIFKRHLNPKTQCIDTMRNLSPTFLKE